MKKFLEKSKKCGPLGRKKSIMTYPDFLFFRDPFTLQNHHPFDPGISSATFSKVFFKQINDF